MDDIDRQADLLADILERLAAVERVGHVHRGGYITAGRPSAVALGIGNQIYDSTLHKPIWSDGVVWRDATGTAV